MAEETDAAPTTTPLDAELDDAEGFRGAVVPEDARIARGLAGPLGVYVEEDGTWTPPADPLNLELFRAIVALESRVIAAEERLKHAGH
jgi:hypothetical protein